MHLTYQNVNDAFQDLVYKIESKIIPTSLASSRNGDVIVCDEPMTITYEQPRERVLFNEARDANPFFHLYESLWMLAGRNDVAPLAYYNSKMAQYSDDGTTFNGAYGYRWRNYWDYSLCEVGGYENRRGKPVIDQLDIIVQHLKANPYSRRAVLEMWEVEYDLLRVDESKDVCCNTHVYFSIRHSPWTPPPEITVPPTWSGEPVKYLDMTVTNRSNDLVLGMLGANVVHFSFLQEYMAGRLGVEVGRYNQFTNNLHAYVKDWQPAKWLRAYSKRTMHDARLPQYGNKPHECQVGLPLAHMRDGGPDFDDECATFVELNKNGEEVGQGTVWSDHFLHQVAQPMCHAFHMHKARDYDAAKYWMERVLAEDWRLAGMQWISKREKQWRTKQVTTT